jgi:hypothetical protein
LLGFLLRWAAAAALVFATWNPLERSFIHWTAPDFPHVEPLQAVAGLALLAAWLFFVRATWKSIGIFGILLGAAFLASVVWLFVSWGWLDLREPEAMAWVVCVTSSVLLAIGVSWSHLRRSFAGQADVDEIER